MNFDRFVHHFIIDTLFRKNSERFSVENSQSQF